MNPSLLPYEPGLLKQLVVLELELINKSCPEPNKKKFELAYIECGQFESLEVNFYLSSSEKTNDLLGFEGIN